MFFFFFQEQRLEINLRTSESFPLWSYGSYLARIDLCYRKVALIDRICQLFLDGVTDAQLFVSQGSIDLYPEREVQHSDFKSYRTLSPKSESPEAFWQEISSRARPAVFYDDGTGIHPVLPLREGSLDLINATVSSPGDLTVGGGLAYLGSLFSGILEERRREQLHAAQLTTEAFNQMHAMAMAATALNNPGLPPSVRRYQEQVFFHLVRKHQEDLRKLGITIGDINITA